MGKEERGNGYLVGNKQSAHLHTQESQPLGVWMAAEELWPAKGCTKSPVSKTHSITALLQLPGSLSHFVHPAPSMPSLPPQILRLFVRGWQWATGAHFAYAYREPGDSFASDRDNSEVWLGLSLELPYGIKAKLPYVGFCLRARLAWLLLSLVPLPHSLTGNHSKQITFT